MLRGAEGGKMAGAAAGGVRPADTRAPWAVRVPPTPAGWGGVRWNPGGADLRGAGLQSHGRLGCVPQNRAPVSGVGTKASLLVNGRFELVSGSVGNGPALLGLSRAFRKKS